MSKKTCHVCASKPLFTNKRSHSHQANRHIQKINLQKAKINGHSVWVCAKCLKARSKATA